MNSRRNGDELHKERRRTGFSRLLSLAFQCSASDTETVRGSTTLFLFAWAGWMAMLFALSSQESLPSAGTGFSWEDKAEHAIWLCTGSPERGHSLASYQYLMI